MLVAPSITSAAVQVASAARRATIVVLDGKFNIPNVTKLQDS